ncbi:hypothetical protein WHI96_15700 [Pseudonocardia tropica]|uniref:Uncharacterized protein n=1 Tax=Pseudonocardia tropica TaxID=681289 RepID=A0ABV1JX72_9PSEU
MKLGPAPGHRGAGPQVVEIATVEQVALRGTGPSVRAGGGQ